MEEGKGGRGVPLRGALGEGRGVSLLPVLAGCTVVGSELAVEPRKLLLKLWVMG